ncbi:MAG: hypothetical protein JSW53_05780 [Candidatus Bathyarchaeota archaeon]|nr:MAG: hypothetical protein JSW53_05780 [Candidatus Bathyarchaeota archaeon]
MPQKVVCRECGFVLYEDLDLKAPDEIMQQYDGKCPSCGKKLTFTPENIEVKPAE